MLSSWLVLRMPPSLAFLTRKGKLLSWKAAGFRLLGSIGEMVSVEQLVSVEDSPFTRFARYRRKINNFKSCRFQACGTL